jgi:hypothetical protein
MFAIQKKQLTNRPQVIINQTGEHLGHLKDLEISRYKRFIFVNCRFIWVSKH